MRENEEREKKRRERKQDEKRKKTLVLSVVLYCLLAVVWLFGCGLTEATQIHDGGKKKKKRESWIEWRELITQRKNRTKNTEANKR